tara:strand:- start:216 stop:437 length:222 start_codon:yes stop_codon:yes gene_type:complete
MSRPYKYRSISLRYNTYSTLEDLSNIVVKGHKLSNAKTAEIAIENLKENLSEEISNSKSRANGVTNEKTQKEA